MTNAANTTPPPADLSGHEGIANLAARLLVEAAERRREEHEHRQRGGYTGGV